MARTVSSTLRSRIRATIRSITRTSGLTACMLFLGLFPSRAEEPYVAYVIPEGTLGNQDAPGALGMDFDVLLAVEVVRLGVFDSGSDGLALPITARLYDRDTGVEQASLVFTPDDPGELRGGSRFKPLVPTLELPPGFHGAIVAEGYGAAEMNGNCHGNLALRLWSRDEGNCALAFVGSSRYGGIVGSYPAGADAGPQDRYAAGTFEFIPLEDPTPSPAVAYGVTEFTAGNFIFPGPLGMDFDTQSDLEIVRLGVFDSGSDGLYVPITARVFDRDSGTELASLEFTPEEPGDLVGSSRLKILDPPFEVPAGTHLSIIAEGYGFTELAGSLWGGALPITTDSGGCAIDFVGTSRLGFIPGAFPRSPDLGPEARYAAGTLEFAPTAGAVTRPNPPTNLSASPEAGGVRLSWTAPTAGPAPVGYHVYRKVDGSAFVVDGPPIAGTSFLDTSLPSGVLHCYAVRSVLANGIQSAEGGDDCVQTPPPSVPGAARLAVSVPEGTEGNQPFDGALGIDFKTRADIVVTKLGIFDDASDGLGRTFTARLFDRDTRRELASLVFTPEDPGVLAGGYRTKDLTPALGLPADFEGSIVAEGFGVTDRNGNQNVGALAISAETSACAIEFAGHRTGPSGGFPTTFDASSHAIAFAAGTFEFGTLSTPPGRETETVAYTVPSGIRGNQDFVGSLGLDFDIEENIIVTRLGVFDDGSDGLLLPLTAHVYDRDSQAALATLSFTPEDPGELLEGSRFKDLEPPLSLAAGMHCTVVGEGYGAIELNGNVHGVAGLAPWTMDSGGCLIHFVGGGRNGTAGAFPANPDFGPPNRYAAGTFSFVPGPVARFTATPEEGIEPLLVAFDATGSTGSSGSIVEYRWDFGDGTTAAGVTTDHTYARPGRYPVVLTVRDTEGFEATASRIVSVLFDSSDISPWLFEDIGATTPIVTGGARPSSEGGCLDVYAGGKDISLTSDQFLFVHRTFEDDVAIVARISEIAAPTSARVGLMLREDMSPGAKHASVFVTASNPPKFTFVQRKNRNGTTSFAVDGPEAPALPNAWLRLARVGTDVIASYSADGVEWTTLAEVKDLALPWQIEGGIAATARDSVGAGTSVAAVVCDLEVEGEVGPGAKFKRGDKNDDGIVNITDGIFVLNFLFLGGPSPTCQDAADSNDDGQINITDGIFVLNYLFLGGPTPPAPGPEDCGVDATEPQPGCIYTHCDP